MDTLTWFIDIIQQHILQSTWAVLWSTLLWGFLGFAGGLFLAIRAGRAGYFQRQAAWWRLLARVHYVYLPLLFMSLGAGLGFVRGCFNASERFINSTETVLETYGAQYVTSLQIALGNLSPAQKTLRLDEAIGLAGGDQSPSYSSTALRLINHSVLDLALTALDLPGREQLRVSEFLQKLEGKPAIASAVFSAIPEHLHETSALFFRGKYAVVSLFFLPFLLAPAIEYGIYRAFQLAQKKKRTLLGT